MYWFTFCRWSFTPTIEELQKIYSRFEENLQIPYNFTKSTKPTTETSREYITQPSAVLNPQTKTFCSILGVDDPIELLLKKTGKDMAFQGTENVESDSSFIYDSEISLSESNECGNLISPAGKLRLSLPKPKDEGNELESHNLTNINKSREILDEEEDVSTTDNPATYKISTKTGDNKNDSTTCEATISNTDSAFGSNNFETTLDTNNTEIVCKKAISQTIEDLTLEHVAHDKDVNSTSGSKSVKQFKRRNADIYDGNNSF